jgi:PhoPQ-activated pathogenicity-related protein
VIDLLNLKKSMQNHFCAYGSLSPALTDYVDIGLGDKVNTQGFEQLLSLIEPFSYRDRLTMPKLIVNATGDDFFTPDSSRFYFDQLLGPKYLRYVPNANHYLTGSDAMGTVATFYAALATKHPLAECKWKLSEENVLTISFNKRPKGAKLWTAHAPSSRDFRLSSIGPAWKSEELDFGHEALLQVELLEPAEGWSAYTVELIFDGPFHMPFHQTTDVFILPDRLPYESLGFDSLSLH